MTKNHETNIPSEEMSLDRKPDDDGFDRTMRSMERNSEETGHKSKDSNTSSHSSGMDIVFSFAWGEH